MASIEPRINANGVITSYRIIVSGGADYQGNPIKYRMLWTPPRRNMTEKQIQNLVFSLSLTKAKKSAIPRSGSMLIQS